MSYSKYKARSPIQKRGIKTRKKIIEASMALFSKNGYNKTNAMEIASKAGIGTGTFYSYFNNKKEVLIELIRSLYQEYSENVLSGYNVQKYENLAYSYDEGKKVVSFMIQNLYSAHTLNPELHRELSAMILIDKEIEKINREEEQKVLTSMVSFLMNFKDYLRVTNIEAAARLVYRTSDETIHYIIFSCSESVGKGVLSELEDMICRYLLKP